MKTVYLKYERHPEPRIVYGIRLLTDALESCGYTVNEDESTWTWDNYRAIAGPKIYVGNRSESPFIQKLEELDVLLYHSKSPEGDGFYLGSCPGSLITVTGGSDSGVLYGCQELARIVRTKGTLPQHIAFGDAPQFTLRGPAIGLQKTTIEPPRSTYEYPITADRFPWFYDREMWTQFLDMMVEERCNVVYIWSGHPFASLVQLDDYPEAQEVTDEEFNLNVDTFHWLTEEADKRGIWVVLKFYNIHLPLPFAEKHGLELRQQKPLPLTSDYYKKSIAAFVRTFPNVGLMVCLGEALQGQMYGVEWFNETILPGVEEGLRGLNRKEKPPIVLRAHAIDPEKVLEKALPKYSNLFTMAKYNGESLTTWTPRGKWQQTHQNLGGLDSVHIINVHILANLEPFRYGAPSFIRKAMQAAKYRLHANGLHLYPLFYWDWPYAPDKTEPRLKQMDRDWLWFASWFRYAWNPDRDPQAERVYWTEMLEVRYGSKQASEAILDAYEAFGECAPKLIRRFGITEGNRQTFSLGMTMSQLTNASRYMPWKDLWDSHAPAGERLDEYVLKEMNGDAHVGETPVDIIEDAERHAYDAMQAITQARNAVTRNVDEFERLAADVEAIYHMVQFYGDKVRAAIRILTYKHTVKGNYFTNVHLLEEAAQWMENSVASYRRLTQITNESYLFANSMQTPQRKVPMLDGMKYKHWQDCLPIYEHEYNQFCRHVRELKAGDVPAPLKERKNKIEPYHEIPFILHSEHMETYEVKNGQRLFTDGDIHIVGCAEEINGLTGVRFSQMATTQQARTIDIELEKPGRVLVGYFNSDDEQWLQPPSLEENTHAEADGSYEPILRNGVKPYVYPSVNIHMVHFDAGRHVLNFGKGTYLILGVIEGDTSITPRDVIHRQDGVDTLDWLYE